MGKIGNTIAMLKILESGKKYTVQELADRLEVTTRMVKQYKIDLEKAGIYIDTISGIYGGYVYNSQNDYNISFNIKDVNILERLYFKIKDDDKKEIEELIEKIRTIVIYSNHSKKLNDEEHIQINKRYNIISNALKHNRKIKFNYNNKERLVIPHNISFYKEHTYITGYSLHDEDLRTYNLFEINSIEIIK